MDASSDFEDLEKRRAQSRLASFRGTAKVKLTHLSFPNPISCVDPKNVNRLKRVFELEGCSRLEPEHHIPALVDDEVFNNITANVDFDLQHLKGAWAEQLIELQFPEDYKLECLHGQQRVAAAEVVLSASDRWWVVDLYGRGRFFPCHVLLVAGGLTSFAQALDTSAKQAFREGYTCGRVYKDGEIYRSIRLAHHQHDTIAQQRWRSRLSPSKGRKLEQLLRRFPIRDALDDLLPIRGLWKALTLGSIDNLLSPRCDEVC